MTNEEVISAVIELQNRAEIFVNVVRPLVRKEAVALTQDEINSILTVTDGLWTEAKFAAHRLSLD